jgi:hypothetical protein
MLLAQPGTTVLALPHSGDQTVCSFGAIQIEGPSMASVRRRISDNARSCPNTNPSLSIIYRDIDELQANPENPRLHSKKQIKQIARSIQDFGFNVPFLVDRNLRLIAGHGRAEALKLLGIRKVPTICLEHLSESQARAFTIADNRLTEIATWDDHKLAEQFKILTEITLDFSPESTGFAMAEIDVLIEAASPEVKGSSDPADDLPETRPVAVTREGDLWLLGPHRVYCGNSLNPGSHSALMESRLAAMVFTDPPFNVKIDGHAMGLGGPSIRIDNFLSSSRTVWTTVFASPMNSDG